MADQREASVYDSLHKSHLQEVLYKQKQESKFCDVIMKVCGTEIYAHSNVLAGASPYFNSFLSQDLPRQFSQRSPQVIEIQIDGSEDSSVLYEKAVTSIVDFVYTGSLVLNEINAHQVFEIAKIMQIDSLVKYCELWLENQPIDVTIFGLREIGVQTQNQVSLLSAPHMVDASVETLPRQHFKYNDKTSHSVSEKSKSENSDSIKAQASNIEACVSELQPKKKRGRPSKRQTEQIVMGPELGDEIKNKTANSQTGKETDNIEKLQIEENSNNVIETNQAVNLNVRRSSRAFKPTPKAKNLHMDRFLKIKTEKPDDGFNNNDKTKSVSLPKEKPEDREKEIIADNANPNSFILAQTEGEKQVEEGPAKDLPSTEESQMPLRELATANSQTMDTEFSEINPSVKVEGTVEIEEHKSGKVMEMTSMAYKCDHCDYCTDNVYRFRRHMMRHGMARFKCSECEFKTAMIREYKNHVKIHLLEKNICHYCELKCNSKEDLNEHLLKHKGNKPYFCNLCGFRFKLHAQLKLHMPKHSDETPFKCRLCSAAFKWKHALKNHMVVHSGKKEHLCDICGYATAHKGQLKGHRLIHTGETFKCPVEGCRYQATKLQNMKYHMLTHTKEKPHQCEVCGQAFSLSKNMRRHRLLHSQVRHLSCDLCSFQTTRLDKLKDHKYKDHRIGEPPSKKIKITDMVAANVNLNPTDDTVSQQGLSKEQLINIMPKKEILVMAHIGEVTLQKGLESVQEATVVKQEGDSGITQAILIPTGAVAQETVAQSVDLIEEEHQLVVPSNVDGIGRVVMSEEGAHLGYIDKDGNFLPVAASGDIEQNIATEVVDNVTDVIEGLQTATVEQVVEHVESSEIHIPADQNVEYTELVLPADQVQALVDHVNSAQNA